MMSDAFVAAREIMKLIQQEKSEHPDNQELQEALSKIEKRCLEIESSSLGGWY